MGDNYFNFIIVIWFSYDEIYRENSLRSISLLTTLKFFSGGGDSNPSRHATY